MADNFDLINPYLGFNHYVSILQRHKVLGDVFVDFGTADSAKEKFKLTRVAFTKYDVLPKTMDTNRDWDIFGSENAAIRTRGNNYFKAKNYYAAIDQYTKCLTVCKPGSECWAYALANRSAALFQIKYYQVCLEDIDRALMSELPTRLTYKLYKRAGHAERLLGHGDLAKHNYNECLKHLGNATMSDSQKQSFKVEIVNFIGMCENLKELAPKKNMIVDEVLLGGKNEFIPAFSSYLELKYSANMERGVYAAREINLGEVVVIDEPYISQPYSDNNNAGKNVCCYTNCLKLSVAVIPCSKCQLEVYCDEECMQKADKEHRIICKIMSSISKMPGSKTTNSFAMKWFLKECSQMGLKKFCSVVDQLFKTKTDPMTRGFDENGLYMSNNFLTAYTLDIGEDGLSIDLLFFVNCLCAEMLHYLMLSGFDIPECYLDTVGASLAHMLNVINVSCLTKKLFNSHVGCPTKNFFATTVLNLYPSISLFKHSCDANILASGRVGDKRRVLTAVQPIPKGNQLFISSGLSYASLSKNLRKLCYLKVFMRECCCQPCLENWPVKRYLPIRFSVQNVLNPDNDIISMLQLECDKFNAFKNTVQPEDYHLHLNYLFSFLKLLFTNVKRPFGLYNDCFEFIQRGLPLLYNDEETNIAYSFYNKL